MYKVFFKDRIVYFCDNFSKVFEKNKGLFYKYNNLQELTQIIDAFYALSTIDQLFIFHTDILELIDKFKTCFHFVEAAGGVVFNERGEFLVIKRNGIWDLPKGKLEKKETFDEAALREVEEETGLSGLSIRQPIVSTYHTYHLSEERVLKKTKWFEMYYDGSETPVPQSSENITEVRWVLPGKTGFVRENTFPSIMDVFYIRDLI